MKDVSIRAVTAGDAPFLAEIYRPYVLDTAISFETEPPDDREFRERILRISQDYPYFVLCEGGIPVGYAYASAFHPRKAYEKSVEASIYLRQDCRGKGYGKMLYNALEHELKRRGFAVMYACIAATSRRPDKRLTDTSILFHERLGFEHAGYFKGCAQKFGCWYNMVYMQKPLVSDFKDLETEDAPAETGDVYDAQKRVTGKTFLRGALFARSMGICVHVCVFNDKNELLIQQRADSKASAPGMWDFSASGMVDAGETSQQGASRELREELGLSVDIDFPPVITKFFFNTYNDYYFVSLSPELPALRLQESEVQAVRWAGREQVRELYDKGLFLSYPWSLISLVFDVGEGKD